MGKPYASELAQLQSTCEWAIRLNIDKLKSALKTCSYSPLVAVGSGGSLTAAHIMVGLHQKLIGRIGNVVTPFEVSSYPIDPSASYWLLTSGGGNADILNAFKFLTAGEPKQLGAICATRSSSLSAIVQEHSFVDFFDFDCPTGKDGFLATNSLVASAVILSKAYAEIFSSPDELFHLENAVSSFFENDKVLQKWRQEADCLWSRNTTVVLHGMGTKPGAVDLESKFTEAALGAVQLADYRNFAHGRHHWLAKKGSESGIIAFMTPEDRALAESTLSFLPQDVPIARFDFDGRYESSFIKSLLLSIYLSGWAGEAKGIDPGRPGVPPFGETLYNLPKERDKSILNWKQRSYEEVVIERKTGQTLNELKASDGHDFWLSALSEFTGKLKSANIAAVIADYDGTLVDTRDRFFPPSKEIASELIRLLSVGIILGIATGRGPSVRRDLRKVIPEKYWRQIFIGYYNGAEIGPLSNGTIPDNSIGVCASLEPLYLTLEQQPEFQRIAEISPRQHQITVEPKGLIQEGRLWEMTNQLINSIGGNHVVVRSSHSVDILQQGVSKGKILDFIRAKLGPDENILTIGDRGRWPGNDYVLLAEPFSLSVDEVSSDPQTCWNLAPVGQRGLSVTLLYLKCLVNKPKSKAVYFAFEGDK